MLPPVFPRPPFQSVAGIAHTYHGPRPNGLEGAIVHYDAGRTRPTKGPPDPQFGARATLAYAHTAGFAYVTIARDGTILLPANMDWDRWGSHAGTSRCPATGRTGVSRYYVGFEINSPGLVHATSDPDIFVPWFDAVRDAKGNVVLDNKGRAAAANPSGELYRKAAIRSAAPRANIRAGIYVPFTTAQMDALTATLLWLKARNPATFRLDRVFGHDEVAPARKCDPGASLGAPGGAALTMPDYRAHLAARWNGRI